MFTFGIVIGYVVVSGFIANLTRQIAENKNRSGTSWFFYSFLGSLIVTPIAGILVLLTVGFLSEENYTGSTTSSFPPPRLQSREDAAALLKAHNVFQRYS